MTSRRDKRLTKEWKLWNENKNKIKNIWLVPVEPDKIDHFHALIVGPPNCPMSLGFFVFDITYPDTYPDKPPIVKFLNTNNNIRVHPNLYGNGKVCLSVLNTFSGPGWTCVMRTETILVALQSRIGMEHPIQGEPGYEKMISEEYNNYVEAVTLSHFIDNFLFSTESFPNLKEIALDYFNENKENYKKLIKHTGKHTFHQGKLHNCSITVDYELIDTQF